MTLELMSPGSGLESGNVPDSLAVLDEFTAAWARGQAPAVEKYLGRLDPADSRAAVELVYREFCLAEADGSQRELSHYLDRLPRHRAALERLIRLHGECPPSLLGRWMETTPSLESLPEAGDSIGPYVLLRELGRGGFARVFLAEQTNLENRLVVLKVSTRMTREPWLLARVRHAHIVEIVSHARVNDDAFQLICMPFWGGATLAAVLAARQGTSRRPDSGIDLLEDLDLVAAPEYPSVAAARPAREILAGLSHSQAIAWIGARLAEALDHAFSRHVAHGDVKPSNILLSADGNPLLLDFNLARDWSPAGLSHSTIDPGGTLAYMAPERLRGLATNKPTQHKSSLEHPGAWLGPCGERDSESEALAGQSRDEHRSGPHQADLYSLGIVMLEALTGRPPAPVPVCGGPAPSPEFDRQDSVASAYAAARAQGASAILREAEAAGWRSIPPGLRAILKRCLETDPGQRYRRGLELAEDLDRWRADRPLLCTTEPFWGQTVPRLLRRQRTAVLAAALSLSVILATTAVALVKSEHTLQALGIHKIGRLWDDAEARAYRFQKPNAPRLLQADDFHEEIATRALKEYDVLGPDDWRRRDDVRTLPKADCADLEVWLMEQVYLYCRGLADRPHSPKDWSRAVEILDHVGGPHPTQAFAALRQHLSAGLGSERPIPPRAKARTLAASGASWLNEYLLGVVAECELESECGRSTASDGASDKEGSNRESMVRELGDCTRRAAERALEHYNRFLASYPDSYWGHYRAAAASYGLGGRANLAITVNHLAKCLERRPNNPMLHNHLAASLMALDQHRQAQHEIEIAIEAAPDLAEFYRTRARIRTTLGETGGLAEDLYHFDLLGRYLPRLPWGQSRADSDRLSGESAAHALAFPASFDFGTGPGGRAQGPGGEKGLAPFDPEELADRTDFANRIREAGEPELAEAELGKILILKPDDIRARMTRGSQAVNAGRLDEAYPDIEAVIHDPGLVAYVRDEPMLLARFHEPNRPSLIKILLEVSRHYCSRGRITEGRTIARRALDLAIEVRLPTGEAHYNLARVNAASIQLGGNDVHEAAEHLFRAFVAHPLYKQMYMKDVKFDAGRARIDALLKDKPDPGEHYRRRLAHLSSAKGR